MLVSRLRNSTVVFFSVLLDKVVFHSLTGILVVLSEELKSSLRKFTGPIAESLSQLLVRILTTFSDSPVRTTLRLFSLDKLRRMVSRLPLRLSQTSASREYPIFRPQNFPANQIVCEPENGSATASSTPTAPTDSTTLSVTR